MSDLCREIESFLERIEELLEMCKHEHMDKNSFISCGHKLLVELYDMGLTKNQVYQSLHKRFMLYRDHDELKSDLLADLMDFVVGFCAPCYRIWND